MSTAGRSGSDGLLHRAASPHGVAGHGDADDVHVLFIGGASRTGSTVLSLLLGSLPGHFAAGEIRYVWLRGVCADQLCECGRPFRSCDLWRAVIDAAIGSYDEAAAAEYARLWRRTAAAKAVLRRIPFMSAASHPD